MNANNLLITFLFLSTFSFTACSKDEKIDINQLIGSWNVINDDPLFAMDGSITYTFNTDKTCSVYSYNALSNTDTTVYRTYIISVNNDLITLFDDENRYTEQYNILKLTSSEMQWTNASPGDGNTDKKLKKVK